eukprot:8132-Prymnesium_polylepis.1
MITRTQRAAIGCARKIRHSAYRPLPRRDRINDESRNPYVCASAPASPAYIGRAFYIPPIELRA